LQYGILDVWNASALYLKTLATNGNCSLNVSAAIKEIAINDAEASATEGVDLTTVSWLPGDDLIKARKRCNHFYAAIDTSIWGLTEKLSDLKNRPDPPSEATVRQIAQAVHELDKAVAQYAQDGNMTTSEVFQQMGRGDGLRSPFAPAASLDLTGLRLRDSQQTDNTGEPPDTGPTT